MANRNYPGARRTADEVRIGPEPDSHGRRAVPSPARAVAPVPGVQGGLRAADILNLQRSMGNQAVQRLLAQKRPPRTEDAIPVQRRMNWAKKQWGGAKYLNASSGGGGGVLFVGEQGREVVVKPGEDMAAESAMAALLMNKVGRSRRTILEKSQGKAKGKGGINIVAPGIRTVEKDESKQIKAALVPLLDQVGTNDPGKEGTFKNNRARQLVKKLDEPGVVVQDLAVGQELKEAATVHKDHTEDSLGDDRQLKASSPLRIFQDKRSVTALGRVTAVDLFTGNKDRLFQYNAENLMVTPTSVTAIDNIWMGTNMSYFQTATVKDGNERDRTITRDEALAEWKADPDVKRLAAGDYVGVAEKVWGKILDNAAWRSDLTMKEGRVVGDAFQATMTPHKPMFLKAFGDGLGAGKKQLVASLDRLLKRPDKLQKLAPGVDLSAIMDSVRDRKRFLQGKT